MCSDFRVISVSVFVRRRRRLSIWRHTKGREQESFKENRTHIKTGCVCVEMRAHIFGQSAKAKEGATRSFAVSSFREEQKTLSAGIKNIYAVVMA
jgi:hypothetical protein